MEAQGVGDGGGGCLDNDQSVASGDGGLVGMTDPEKSNLGSNAQKMWQGVKVTVNMMMASKEKA